ncbi:hypothetical protein GGS23DRAFT_609755 [Durotheca rogersii]|uniref:uncharacterized protein n=1 Tax=Durotheca rogersii TaxID=419775 RepID=UPI00221F3650|nr:uncharacterized protein GGS23DRAFT_609755 [Durotheca rogersii]KAI5863219.1 hypothetical protein GGS23DRAFT_609755 [Durotheca rogersii]
MDTVNSIANTAAKAVWGTSSQHGSEPVSGQTGDTSKGEPYDAGNIEGPQAQSSKARVNSGPYKSSKGTPASSFSNLKSRKGAQAQEDEGYAEAPQTHAKAASADADEREDGVEEDRKLDGPGPKPLDELAREHGGDAGDLSKSEENPAKGKGGGVKETGKETSPDSESAAEGTGEKYVRSSGLQAEGGDFDATKPGAGREADRLMEEMGMHSANAAGGQSGGPKGGSTGGAANKTEKKSLAQKIKDKLHHH